MGRVGQLFFNETKKQNAHFVKVLNLIFQEYRDGPGLLTNPLHQFIRCGNKGEAAYNHYHAKLMTLVSNQ